MTLILQGTDNSVSSPAVQGGTAGTTTGVYYPASNQVAIATNGTQAMLANSVQGVQFANAIGVGATTPSTSGAGITFPATQSASSDANTLDDYEEGTWTPTFTNLGTTAIIYTARYIKVGSFVWCYVGFTCTSTPTANSSRFTIPFTSTTYSGGTWTQSTGAGGVVEVQAGSTCYFSTTAPSASGVFYCTFTFQV